MPKWTFEPGHTAAAFCVKHMMVSWVRGHFKNLNGTMEFDPENPANSAVEIEINANELWSGDSSRDDHLRGADFLDVKNHPKITFKGNQIDISSANEFKVTGDLTIRGITRTVTLDVHYLGQWQTPFWEDGVDKGPKTRAGFLAETRINRLDFGVSWNDKLAVGGVVVGSDVLITIDVEAILEE
ncbi:YceI family protein [candidate division KSB1 bacterium]|nr:YceI family protein [candidate division KSB1 bacterium]